MLYGNEERGISEILRNGVPSIFIGLNYFKVIARIAEIYVDPSQTGIMFNNVTIK